MLEHYRTLRLKPKNIDGLKKVLQSIWNQLPQDSVNKAIMNFTKRLRACVKGGLDISNELWDNCLTTLNTGHHIWLPILSA